MCTKPLNKARNMTFHRHCSCGLLHTVCETLCDSLKCTFNHREILVEESNVQKVDSPVTVSVSLLKCIFSVKLITSNLCYM